MATSKRCTAALAGALLIGSIPSAWADHQSNRFAIRLMSYQEVPSVSSVAVGTFRGTINADGTITYELNYDRLVGDVRQAHIHFGQRGVNGGISVFLCQTTTNPDPTGLAPVCPASPGRATATLREANIVGPGGQGIAAGELAELVSAIRAGVAYVNVHSSTFPGGEIRGQFRGALDPALIGDF